MFAIGRSGFWLGSSWVAAVLVATTAWSQDPVEIAPEIYMTVLDNEYVRVCEATYKPGAKIGMHSHPDQMVYALTGGKMRITYRDGRAQVLERKVGAATWVMAGSHTGENVGTTEVKLVVVELKKPAASPSVAVKSPEGQDPAALMPSTIKVLLENERVRVLDVTLKAGAKEPPHWHPHHLGYGLTDARLRFTTADGKSSERSLSKGQAVWNEPVSHTVENIGSDARVLAVEFRDLAAAGSAPARPDRNTSGR